MTNYPVELDPSEDAQVLMMGWGWDDVETGYGDDPADVSEWGAPDDDRVCMDCSQPMSGPDDDMVEVLTITTVAGVVMHWHPKCWLNPTNEVTLTHHDKAGWMKL